MTGDAVVNTYIARQAATLGRRCERLTRPPWQPRLSGAKGHCLGVLRDTPGAGSTVSSMALRADGRSLVTGGSEGRLRCRHLESGALLWEGSERHAQPLSHIALSRDGARLATASADATVRIWNAANGHCTLRCTDRNNAAQQLGWSSDNRRLAAVSTDDTLRIWDAQTGQPLLHRKGYQDTIRCVAWSPDDRWLACGAADRTLCIWDVRGGDCVQRFQAHEDWVVGVAWSPDSRYLASLGNDHWLCVWDAERWCVIRRWPAHPQAHYLRCVRWSPDGRYLASAARDGTLRVWDAADGRERLCYAFPETYVWELVWAPDGTFLISGHEGDSYRFWDCRELVSAEYAVAAMPTELPEEMAGLPRALAGLHRLKLYPPLSLLRDLLLLCGGGEPEGQLAVLAVHPGVRRLADLRWPAAARIGLVALLLRELPLHDWRPPARLSPRDLSVLLTTALTGEAIAPLAPDPPLAALHCALAGIDERCLSWLAILGADAVAADPGLPLRLRHRQAAVPVLHKMQRRWLNARVPPLAGGGTARHDGGPGREGWTTRGALRDLQAAQLALPTSVFLSRYWRRELLYYAHGHQEQYPLRAGVLVLDVSPPCFGPVEAVTRLAAHIITASLPAARLPTVMITADGMGWVMRLEEPADKLDVWTTRSLEPARAVLALRLAGILRRTLDDGNGPEPPVVVLSHAWFGAEETISAMPGLRGLFVQYPGQRVEPVLAAHCERWVSIGAHELPDLLNRLRRLLT